MPPEFIFVTLLVICGVTYSNTFFLNGGPSGFGGGGGGMCMPISRYCPLRCPNGYQKDNHGCAICRCAVQPNPTEDPTNLQTSGIQQQQLHLHAIQNPCVATMSMCPLRCNSFAKGPTGCELCMCSNTQQVTASATTAGQPSQQTPVAPLATDMQQTPSPPPTTKQPAATTNSDCALVLSICNERCHGHYLTDPSDCTFCVCRSQVTGSSD